MPVELSSDFEMPIIEERPPMVFPQVGRVEPEPTPIYNQVVPGEVNGARILKPTGYNHQIAGALIATRKNWKEILETIVSPEQIKNVGWVVIQIRQGLGLPIDVDISALTGEGKVLDLDSKA